MILYDNMCTIDAAAVIPIQLVLQPYHAFAHYKSGKLEGTAPVDFQCKDLLLVDFARILTIFSSIGDYP